MTNTRETLIRIIELERKITEIPLLLRLNKTKEA